jgi:ABC-type branched-subunit amino acid transport system substrate-binding protein
MHVILREQEAPGEESTMCIERNAQSAIILKGDFDQLDQLVQIAASMKVPEVLLLIDPGSVSTFEEVGWEVSDRVVMKKKASKSK